jgi:acetylxylan esterase
MKSVFLCLAAAATLARAQDRCDAPYPNTFCNTTEILAYQTDDCRPYHVFIARGSDEPYPGRLGNLTSQICEKLGADDCGFENIEYPAKSTAWGKEEWCKSASKGAANGQAQVKAHVEKCPDAKLILVGLSQGASVTLDIVGGGGGKVFECTQDDNPALDASSAPGSNIAAIVTFGAVARNRGQDFTVGAGKDFDGQRARTPEQLKALKQYSKILLDYCHYSDPICAVGSTPVNVTEHLNYFFEHNEEAGKWIVDTAQGKKVSRPEASSTSSAMSQSHSPIAATKVIESIHATATPTGSHAEASQTGSAGSTQTGAAGAVLAGLPTPLLAVLSAAVLPLALWC